MPVASNIVVKNTANVDKTFTLLSPAAGDGSMALWALKEGLISTVFPQLTTQANRNPSSRSLNVKFFVPSSYQDTVTGLTVVKNRAEINVKVAIPNDFPESNKDDFATLFINLMASVIVKAQIRDAISAT